VYEIDRAHVTSAAVLIAYAGIPSFGVGIEVELAREHSVPVIVVAERERPISRLLLGNPAVVEVVKFADLDGLRRTLTAALAAAASVTREGARPMVSDDVVVRRFIASLEEARRLPIGEVTALLRVGELDGEAASAVRDAIERGRLFGAGLRDLVGRYALRGAGPRRFRPARRVGAIPQRGGWHARGRPADGAPPRRGRARSRRPSEDAAPIRSHNGW